MVSNEEGILVSVVIPAYNRGSLLSRAVESVLAQTHVNLEIIIVNDGSQDNTEAVIRSFHDTRIVAVSHAQNKGVSAARNTGIKTAKGDFIAFLDSDDMYLPGKIEANLRLFARAGGRTGLVASNYFHEIEGKRVRAVNGAINKTRFIPLLSTWLVRRDVFEKTGLFNETIVCFEEDAEFFWRFRTKFSYEYDEEPLAVKFFSPDCSTVDMDKRRKVRKKVIADLQGQGQRRLAARFMNIQGKEYWGLGQKEEARRYFMNAFLTYPFNWGYLVKFVKTVGKK